MSLFSGVINFAFCINVRTLARGLKGFKYVIKEGRLLRSQAFSAISLLIRELIVGSLFSVIVTGHFNLSKELSYGA